MKKTKCKCECTCTVETTGHKKSKTKIDNARLSKTDEKKTGEKKTGEKKTGEKKTRTPTAYSMFVKNNYDKVRSLPVKERFKEISAMWKKKKK